jgi:hypothetical protein
MKTTQVSLILVPSLLACGDHVWRRTALVPLPKPVEASCVRSALLQSGVVDSGQLSPARPSEDDGFVHLWVLPIVFGTTHSGTAVVSQRTDSSRVLQIAGEGMGQRPRGLDTFLRATLTDVVAACAGSRGAAIEVRE